MNYSPYAQWLDEHIPKPLSIHDLFKVLKPPKEAASPQDYQDHYFNIPAINLTLLHPIRIFTHKNVPLLPKERQQIVGLISLLRYPLDEDWLATLPNANNTQPNYANQKLHSWKRIRENTYRIIIKEKYDPMDRTLVTMAEMLQVLPDTINKSYLSDYVFTNTSKTQQLRRYHFTKDVLLTFGMSITQYKNNRDLTALRYQIAALIAYFQIPLRSSMNNQLMRIRKRRLPRTNAEKRA